MDVSERCDKACEILQVTHDGNDLDPAHLHLVESAVNGFLTEEGYGLFQRLHAQCASEEGYKKPWLCKVEHLTRDAEGYVYWKGIQVEHYSHSSYDKMKADAEELGRRCRHLESIGVEVNGVTAVWAWAKYEPEGWAA